MLRVFLVEDESTIRETLRDTVLWNQVGYEFAGEAGDGEMALPLLRQVKPDVLITDIRMPFMDGLELSKIVLREFPHMKIIILSGYDDFDYARKAIDLGVERYLLKPVTKNTLMDVLSEVKEKIESETEQQNYLNRFRLEAQEYEQYARLQFMEQVVSGGLSVPQIYEQAEKLELDIRAESYAMAFFSTPMESPLLEKQFSEANLRIRDALMGNFLKYPEYMLLHWRLNTYLVLIMAPTAAMPEWAERCVEIVRQVYTAETAVEDWYVAVSPATTRLSALPGCFQTLSRLWAYRHIVPRQHILTEETTAFLAEHGSAGSLAGLDPARMSPAILRSFLESGDANEVDSFVEQYLLNVSEAVSSPALRQYLAMNAYFCAAGFLQELGVDSAQLTAVLGDRDLLGQAISAQDLQACLEQILLQTVHLRDNASNRQGRSLYKQAVCYLEEHYTDEALSLNQVAREISVSANYLSAVFSQEMGMTFTEYVTGKRMEKAKELLRTTNKRSGEVAFAVGYRDPHYFSFLFKKTQGCTPRDYRAGGGRA